MKEKILKAISHSPLMYGGDGYILLDYSVCGNDPKLISKLRLMESLIEKHFNVTYYKSYLGIREVGYVCD